MSFANLLKSYRANICISEISNIFLSWVKIYSEYGKTISGVSFCKNFCIVSKVWFFSLSSFSYSIIFINCVNKSLWNSKGPFATSINLQIHCKVPNLTLGCSNFKHLNSSYTASSNWLAYFSGHCSITVYRNLTAACLTFQSSEYDY
jgi:hypothetical protein